MGLGAAIGAAGWRGEASIRWVNSFTEDGSNDLYVRCYFKPAI